MVSKRGCSAAPKFFVNWYEECQVSEFFVSNFIYNYIRTGQVTATTSGWLLEFYILETYVVISWWVL